MGLGENSIFGEREMVVQKDWTFVDSCLMEKSAQAMANYLCEHGLLAGYSKHSRSILEEPFVEWTWRVFCGPRNNSERELLRRLMTNWINGYVDTQAYQLKGR